MTLFQENDVPADKTSNGEGEKAPDANEEPKEVSETKLIEMVFHWQSTDVCFLPRSWPRR